MRSAFLGAAVVALFAGTAAAQSGPGYLARTGAPSDALSALSLSPGVSQYYGDLSSTSSVRPLHDESWSAADRRKNDLRWYLSYAEKAGRLTTAQTDQAFAELRRIDSDQFYGRASARDVNNRLKELARNVGISLEFAQAR